MSGQFYRAGELMELANEWDDLEWPRPEPSRVRVRIAWLALVAAAAIAFLVLAIVAA